MAENDFWQNWDFYNLFVKIFWVPYRTRNLTYDSFLESLGCLVYCVKISRLGIAPAKSCLGRYASCSLCWQICRIFQNSDQNGKVGKNPGTFWNCKFYGRNLIKLWIFSKWFYNFSFTNEKENNVLTQAAQFAYVGIFNEKW